MLITNELGYTISLLWDLFLLWVGDFALLVVLSILHDIRHDGFSDVFEADLKLFLFIQDLRNREVTLRLSSPVLSSSSPTHRMSSICLEKA